MENEKIKTSRASQTRDKIEVKKYIERHADITSFSKLKRS